MWELNHKEGWALRNWYFCIVVLEKTLESPLDCKEIKPVDPKGNQLWIFIGRTDAEAEAPVLWPLDAKSQLTGENSDAGKDWRQKEKRVAEDGLNSVVKWLNGITESMDLCLNKLWDSEGQRSLVCCSLWSHKQSDTTYQLSNKQQQFDQQT